MHGPRTDIWCVIVVVLVLMLVLAAPAQAAGSGGAQANPFSVSPANVEAGGAVTFAFQAAPGTLARVDLIAPGKPAVRARLGRVGRTGRISTTWTAALGGGQYTARLVLTKGRRTRYVRSGLSVTTPASLSVAGSAIFPVQGPFNFGGELSRFGSGRPGHIHQGQDIAADAGTPVVTPRAGMVSWISYQAAGAGYYVVIAGDDGRHYVFMHLQANSTMVAKGQPVTAGQRIASVGSTGGSDGPHLHFEIWLNGWRASKASGPIDPLPELEAWSAST
jgi:murein DD-endopeptidase MepM/ murein hydrolase activator NlpD